VKENAKYLFSISGVTQIQLPHHVEDNGDLIVMEELMHVPFTIARVFVVRASVGAVRGQHAHKACKQFLICTTGRVEVICDDGFESMAYILDRPDLGLLIPPSIWAQQIYQTLGTVLTVLCDRPYEVSDYIRDYDEFKEYREVNRFLNFNPGKR